MDERPAGMARKDLALAVLAGEAQKYKSSLPDRHLVEVPLGWLRAAQRALVEEPPIGGDT